MVERDLIERVIAKDHFNEKFAWVMEYDPIIISLLKVIDKMSKKQEDQDKIDVIQYGNGDYMKTILYPKEFYKEIREAILKLKDNDKYLNLYDQMSDENQKEHIDYAKRIIKDFEEEDEITEEQKSDILKAINDLKEDIKKGKHSFTAPYKPYYPPYNDDKIWFLNNKLSYFEAKGDKNDK